MKSYSLNSLLVIGAGSFSPEVEEIAGLLGYTDIAFLDDNPSTAYCSPVIGTTADIAGFRSQYDTAIVALGNNEIRMKYHEELKRCGYNIPILIHPTAYVSPTAEIAPGCIIRAKAVVSRDVKIGEASILNVGALIDHHVEIGYGCHILMGAVVRNKAKVNPLTRVESLSLVQ
jgi:UDP-3-O-[3-hydroxymyristoyl] glucosamine N-acyltransferase